MYTPTHTIEPRILREERSPLRQVVAWLHALSSLAKQEELVGRFSSRLT